MDWYMFAFGCIAGASTAPLLMALAMLFSGKGCGGGPPGRREWPVAGTEESKEGKIKKLEERIRVLEQNIEKKVE